MLLNSLFHSLSVNRHGRDFVVGDIHGHKALLEALLARVNFSSSRDRLFGLGDLIDRGPNSRSMLEMLRDEPWFHSIRGNHEAMFKGSIDDWRVERVWRPNGGKWADPMSKKEMRELASIVDDMPLSLTVDLADGRKIGLVHAELHVNHPWEALARLSNDVDIDPIDDFTSTIQSAALWGRTRIRVWETSVNAESFAEVAPHRLAAFRRAMKPIEGLDLLVAGHTVLPAGEPVRASNMLWIDTGCGYEKGRLTLVEPLLGNYWQAHYGDEGSGEIVLRDAGSLPPPSELPAPVLSHEG